MKAIADTGSTLTGFSWAVLIPVLLFVCGVVVAYDLWRQWDKARRDKREFDGQERKP